VLVGVDGGLGAVAQAEAAEDAGHVVLDGALADDQGLGNLAVGGVPRAGSSATAAPRGACAG
jgi:hypothetical protein